MPNLFQALSRIRGKCIGVMLVFALAACAQTETEGDRLLSCGARYYAERKLSLAESCFASAAVFAEESEDPSQRGAALSSMAIVLLEQGQLSEAHRAAAKAIQSFKRCGVTRCGLGLAGGLRNLALVLTQENRIFEAERVLYEALSLYGRAESGVNDAAEVHNSL